MWAINIYSSLTLSMSIKISEHFGVFREFNMSEHEAFYFSSVHLNNIPEEESLRASYRAKALLQMLNGILLLTGDLTLDYDLNNIAYIERDENGYDGDWRRKSVYTVNRGMEYEELQDPFQADPAQLKKYTGKAIPEDDPKRRNYIVDFFDCAYKADLVKEVLTLFSLSKIDTLFILINTSKIIETIEHDLGLNVREEIKEELLKALSEPFVQSYNYFKNSKFFHYSNTRVGSGIYARHGADKKTYKGTPPSFSDIDANIRVLIYEWINFKLMDEKGYRYPSVEIESTIEPMKDEDYDFLDM
ncbi:hypothetical protein [Priestia megaterium]|uniref:hypothetical protein n=1 Tax=Priestia megaterium TaxID=1404 RepID=UPI0012B7C605|nr:hypothetical protein [Priestia megaterium]